jgi:signal transduction histidine kinase
MSTALGRLRASRWPVVVWRLSAWSVIAVATGLSAPTGWRQVTGAVLLALSAVALQFVAESLPVRARMAAVVVTTALGLACVLVAPSGLGEITVFVAASRLPLALDTRVAQAFVVIDTLLVGAVVGWVSHNLVGTLAGLGIPLLAQRSEERRLLIAERDRAQALLVEVQAGREAEAEAAALQERGRIARDLHDTLAHSLAGLSVQLQAARAVAARSGAPDEVVEPLDRAAELAREGLTEARAAVGALRSPVGLGLAAVGSLVARQPGMAELTVVGTPRPVAPEVGHAVYRVVQEALTNAARYAPGAAVHVELCWEPGRLTVDVRDTGGRAAVTAGGTGLGLAGMSERVGAVGGTLTAGPQPTGGWRVTARVTA